MLPIEKMHVPPLNVTLIDHRAFGRKPVIGSHQIKCLSKFFVSNEDRKAPQPPRSRTVSVSSNNTVVLTLEKQKILNGNDIDWWSKYYASVGEESKSTIYFNRGYEKIIVNFLISMYVLFHFYFNVILRFIKMSLRKILMILQTSVRLFL